MGTYCKVGKPIPAGHVPRQTQARQPSKRRAPLPDRNTLVPLDRLRYAALGNLRCWSSAYTCEEIAVGADGAAKCAYYGDTLAGTRKSPRVLRCEECVREDGR